MDNTNWILIDTETTGFKKPVFAVEIAAQKMQGWEKTGKPFRRMINHGCEIPSEASRVNGYTREILERDGDPPEQVYRDFSEYVDGLPVVAYNLSYDWDQVLIPEWRRLNIDPIGQKGLCAYKLTERLLDPVPAGNCKLQTLRQYFKLPERGAHTALGDVDTVADLMFDILRPIANQRGLDTWEKLEKFVSSEWYPSRIRFGKFKGRPFYEARNNADLKSWLEWLAESKNGKSASMGRWYLEQLESGNFTDETYVDVDLQSDIGESERGLVVYQHMEAEHYQRLIEMARNRLAELEAEFGVEKAKVDSINGKLFTSLRPIYQERDRLKILIQYRVKFIDRLLTEGEEAAEEAADEYQEEKEAQDQEYDSTSSELEGKKKLTEEETLRLKSLWKKLVLMFHPDKYANEPEKQKTYEKLTQIINHAKDTGDIDLLETIAANPEVFIMKQGWEAISLEDSNRHDDLRALYEHLQISILRVIESLDNLKNSPSYDLYQNAEQDPSVIEETIAGQKEALIEEIKSLQKEAAEYEKAIEELNGEAPF